MKARPNLLAGERLPALPFQARSVAKRARLKKAGLALFAEKGYERTSIGQIAGRAEFPVGTFYQHFRSKRQLLLVLMDELIQQLSQIDFSPEALGEPRAGLRQILFRAFSSDLRYLGAVRAWQEAVLSDRHLARKQKKMRSWTMARVAAVLDFLHHLPGARKAIDVPALANVIDSLFWTLLAEACQLSNLELKKRLDSSTHLIYHAMLSDSGHSAS